MSRKTEYERDELRGRFTRFMEVLVQNARSNYLKKLSRQIPTLSLEDLPDHLYARECDITSSDEMHTFLFEEERLAKAFRTLPLMRQRILTLLFVEEMTPAEIAKHLNCSVQHVYNQRSLALKKLRQLLEKGGTER